MVGVGRWLIGCWEVEIRGLCRIENGMMEGAREGVTVQRGWGICGPVRGVSTKKMLNKNFFLIGFRFFPLYLKWFLRCATVFFKVMRYSCLIGGKNFFYRCRPFGKEKGVIV